MASKTRLSGPTDSSVQELLEREILLYRKMLAAYITLDRRHTRKTAKLEPGDRRCKLTSEQVNEIRRLKTQGMSYRQLAKRFGIRSPSTVSKIIHGLCWKNRADEIISL
jgi:DNA invertase Pin-like site-specific DNA recombinase